MKSAWQIFLFILASGLATRDAFDGGKIINPVVCKSDPGQSYALYIPSIGNQRALPIIFCFDPHGDGSLPLRKYRSLADMYGFILVGSNNSKNGNDWQTTEKIWGVLFEDTKARLKINNDRIYTCGFSGGAKVASYIAIQHPGIKGVIANGAALPDGVSAGDLDFSFTAVAGQGDMNLTDLVAVDRAFDNSRTRHRIIIFDGKHEWAPENSMGLAFAGLQFDAMQKGLTSKDGSFIERYIEKSKMRLDAYSKANRLIRARQECVLSISLLNGVSDKMEWFRQQVVMLDKNPLYRKQRREEDELLVEEQNTKTGYMEHFRPGDLSYWTKTIDDLRAAAHSKTAAGGMHQRLLAYLSLAFYSFSNRLINANENSGARYFVDLYKMADPTNSEAWYFSALLHARLDEAKDAAGDLQKAVGLGFRDLSRMQQQPEFRSLSAQMDLPEIEKRM